MKFLIEPKYQKWMLLVPLLVCIPAVINYLFNTKIFRVLQITMLFFLSSFVVVLVAAVVRDKFALGQTSLIIMWVLYYVLGTLVGLYIIHLQENDFCK